MPVANERLNKVDWDARSSKPVSLLRSNAPTMPCKDGSSIFQNISLPEIEVNHSLRSYYTSASMLLSSPGKTDKRAIGISSPRQPTACSTEGTNKEHLPYEKKAPPICNAGDSAPHLEHSASQNNVKCLSATNSKIDTMKGIENQLTSLKQLNPLQNKLANKKRGNNDVQSGGTDFLNNNVHVATKSPSSTAKPCDTVMGGDVMPLAKYEQNGASETCTVTKPIQRVGSKGLLVRKTSHAVRSKASMLSNDLIKLLRKFNMTLKAVPADSEIAKFIAKSARKFDGAICYSHDSSSLHGSNKASEFRTVKCLPSKRLNKLTKPNDRCRLHCKTTCTGTFSKWKLDESYLKSRSAYSSDNGDPKVDHKKSDSRLRTSGTAKFPKRQLTPCRNLNSMQGCSEYTLNNDAKCAKGSSASYIHMPLHDIPLAKAFDDLKNRDKAIRETLEIFTEEGFERKSMSGCVTDVLLDSISSKNDPLLTAAAFQSGNDEMDEFSFKVSTVIIKPAKPLADQNVSCVKMSSLECFDENWPHINDALFDGQKQNIKTAKPTSSTSIESQAPHGDNHSVSTHGKCGRLNTDNNIKMEIMDADHNYHCRDCNHLYSLKVETWTPKEVLSWLSSTIQQFTESESAANDIASRKESHNLTEKLFSHVRDAEGLLSVTLDKLKQICSDNSLARYLFERVQVLWNSRKKEGNGAASNMYSAGQCAISAPPLVNATSMEQLEESVNIDDLFTADGVLGSVDFSDAFDSQTGSYLKYLGNDYIHAPASFRNHESISGNPFSTKSKPSTTNQGGYNAIRFMQSQRHDSYGRSAHYDFHGPTFSNNSYISHAGKVSTPDQNFAVNSAVGAEGWSSSSTRSSDTHLYSTPMSTSTYYDLSTVGHGQSSLAHNNGCVSTGQVPESYHLHKSRDPTCHYANVIVGFREVSDNDSGIHSPSIQSPNKHVGMNALPSRNMYQLSQDHFHRQTYAPQKRYLPTPNDMKTSWTSVDEVAISTQASFPCHKQCCDEKWDCSSTSSNTTAVSVGSESKLLNMDDCKSFHAYEFPENALQNSHTIFSRPSSPNMDKVTLTDNKIYCNETVETIVQRNVTTIYPEFIQVQRSVSMNKSGSCSPDEQDTISNMYHGDSLESNGDLSSVLRLSDNEDRDNGVEYPGSSMARSRPVSNRRHTSDNTDSYVDNLDLKIRRTSGKSITLWEFIRDTLLDPQYCPRLIKWEDRKAGIFRFVQSDVVAGMWGDKKNNPKMTYEKLSRAMRYYYNRGILERVDGRRLVYKFGRNAHGWQQNEIDNSISSRYISETKSVKRETIVHYPQSKIKPRKIKPCRIPVSHCDEVIPATKRRRESRETSPAYLSINSNEASSSDTQILARFNDHTKDNLPSTTKGESLLSTTLTATDDIQRTSATSHDVTISDQPSCIVFVARQEVMTNEETDEKEILLLENTNESSSWPQDAQELLPSKLPSANVLLGKQYKIANTVI